MTPEDILVTRVPANPDEKFVFATTLAVSFAFDTTVNTFQDNFLSALEDTFLRYLANLYGRKITVGEDGIITASERNPEAAPQPLAPEQKVKNRHIN